MFVLLFAALNLVFTWMVATESRYLVRLLDLPLVGTYVRFVYKCMGKPIPRKTKRPMLLLKSEREFERATAQAKQLVRGHDHVLDGVLSRVHENVTLRRISKGTKHSPLGCFLLIGPSGVGKLYLLRVVAKLLFPDGSIEVFDCAKLASNDIERSLAVLVSARPARGIVFENIDKASSDVAGVLYGILKTGRFRAPNENEEHSLSHVVLGFTLACATEALSSLAVDGIGTATRQEQLIDWLASESQMQRTMLNAMTDIYLCETPDDYVKSEVVSLLMQKECRSHATELNSVDPAILATQVVQIDDETGFESTPQRIEKLLRKPLVAAANGKHKKLSLRIRSVTRN